MGNHRRALLKIQEYEQRLAGLGVPVENASWRSATSEELTTIKDNSQHNNRHNGQQASEVKKTELAKRHPSSSNSLEGEDSPTTNSSPISSNEEQDEMET